LFACFSHSSCPKGNNKASLWLVACLFCTCGLFLFSTAAAADNERYKAIPLAAGGYVFILDTLEGHAWTWSNAGPGQAGPSGSNPRIVYQGNVRRNMTPPKAANTPPAAPVPQQQRF
jgi:hypothetical protein